MAVPSKRLKVKPASSGVDSLAQGSEVVDAVRIIGRS